MKISKIRQIFLIVLVIAFVLTCSMVLVACGEKANGGEPSQEVVTHYVTIHPNNGDADIKWTIGDEIPTILKEGYIIEGIYLDGEFTNPISLATYQETGLNEDIEVYVKWTQEECKHTIIVTDSRKEPTCLDTGLTEGSHCATCNKVIVAQQVIYALDHNIIHHNGKNPTCTEDGWGEYDTCSRCEYTTYVEKKALNHAYVFSKIVWTDYTAKAIYVCSNDGNHKEEHNCAITSEVTSAPTCTTKGNRRYTATYDGHTSTKDETLAENPDNHDITHHNAKDPTCTEIGWDAYDKCSRCNYTTYVEKKALGHDWDTNWTTDKEPTCTETGSKSYHCTRCSEKKDVTEISSLGHSYGTPTYEWNADYTKCTATRVCTRDKTHIETETVSSISTITQAQTCTNVELTKYEATFTNSAFGKQVKEDIETKSALNHAYVFSEIIWTDYTAKAIYVCSNDGDHTEEHNCEVTSKETSAPTCTTKGNRRYTATYDVHTSTKDETLAVNPDNHNITNHNAQAPTCTEKGWDAYDTCSRCSYTTYVEKNVLGHDYDIANIVWTWTGYTSCVAKISCKRDGCTYYEEEKASITNAVTLTPTCIATGTKTYTAKITFKSVEYTNTKDETLAVNPDNHDIINHNAKDPTCTDIGWDAYDTCSRCNYTTYVKKNALGHSYTDGVCIRCKDLQTKGLSYELSSDSSYYIVNGIGTCKDTDIHIPITYENKPVKEIKVSAFDGCTNLTSITIPNSVTSIGAGAFTGCSGLKTIKGPVNMVSIIAKQIDISGTRSYSVEITSGTSIGKQAFELCDELISITIPNSVTSIGVSAFNGCGKLTSITIPSSVTSIGNYAFEDCPNIANVYNKSSLNITKGSENYGKVGYYAKNVYNISDANSKLIDDNGYIVYDNTTLVGYIGNKTTLDIPSYITTIKEYAFYGCSSLTSITIPSSVTSIGVGAFYDCRSLTSVTIPNGVTRIEDGVFERCNSLISITIPNSVTSIGVSAFNGCGKLTSITIPSSVTSIGNYAFEDCPNIANVYNKSSLNITKGSENYGKVGYYAKNVYNISDANSKLIDDNGYIVYDNTTLVGYIGNKTTLDIPSYITTIKEYAFYGCSSLTSITIGDSVTSIEYDAFSGCSGIKTIKGPSDIVGNIAKQINADASSYSVEITSGSSIGYEAFDGCTKLTSITIPSSIKRIQSGAFNGCTNVIKIQSNLQYVGNWLIGNTNIDITSADIDQSTKGIGDGAFYKCTKLTSITIPDSVTSIGNYAFYNCISLTSINIPNGVTSIGYGAFSECTKLTSITIPDSVTSIGEKTFYRCGYLTSVTIPDSVTSIGNRAFYECVSLTSITILDSVTSIEYDAFSGCSGIKTIKGPADMVSIIAKQINDIASSYSVVITSGTSIEYEAFKGCSNLTSVTISGSLVAIGESAFNGCSGLTSVTIPKTIRTIGQYAFSGCSKLTTITFKGTSSEWDSVSKGLNWDGGNSIAIECIAAPAPNPII